LDIFAKLICTKKHKINFYIKLFGDKYDENKM